MEERRELTEKEWMKQQLECARKQLFYTRMLCLVLILLSAVLLAFAIFAGYQIWQTAESISSVSGQMETVDQILEDLQTALEPIQKLLGR